MVHSSTVISLCQAIRAIYFRKSSSAASLNIFPTFTVVAENLQMKIVATGTRLTVHRNSWRVVWEVNCRQIIRFFEGQPIVHDVLLILLRCSCVVCMFHFHNKPCCFFKNLHSSLIDFLITCSKYHMMKKINELQSWWSLKLRPLQAQFWWYRHRVILMPSVYIVSWHVSLSSLKFGSLIFHFLIMLICSFLAVLKFIASLVMVSYSDFVQVQLIYSRWFLQKDRIKFPWELLIWLRRLREWQELELISNWNAEFWPKNLPKNFSFKKTFPLLMTSSWRHNTKSLGRSFAVFKSPNKYLSNNGLQ